MRLSVTESAARRAQAGHGASAADAASWFDAGRAAAAPPRTPDPLAPASPAGPGPAELGGSPLPADAGAPARAGGTSPGRVRRGLRLAQGPGPRRASAAAGGSESGGLSPVLASWPARPEEAGPAEMLALGPSWLDSDPAAGRRGRVA